MDSTTTDKTRIRDAATVIVLRDRTTAPKVLMGQRGDKAAFMPNKFVFPGGAVDAADGDVPLARPLALPCVDRLREDCEDDRTHAIGAAAIRELWEETGLLLGLPGKWHGDAPDEWQAFAEQGLLPDAAPLQFVFRAITPPGRPRRFDARFFLIDAGDIASDLDDFSAACDELSHLHWAALDEVRALDLPFITEVVLAEVAARLDDPAPPKSVPFFRNDDEQSLFLRLRGQPMPS
ncbi:NUDIX hydrolase [Marinovum sp. 2_MG-2023]|uniref:NUDIX hydrolase n=1 Tax=unclassified Marinovum TaxID=2647166 RepID=UPI0026E39EA2|nr:MULTISPECIES: NUDIX hydrolase [unclassified Marinovum]MDO6728759.1 NUDIX hydrolase [Marinovum sp. 2_MG-2023]MDO6777825.1 NUDIX hydrolase [Marinovum sp. 1_MG-2023]